MLSVSPAPKPNQIQNKTQTDQSTNKHKPKSLMRSIPQTSSNDITLIDTSTGQQKDCVEGPSLGRRMYATGRCLSPVCFRGNQCLRRPGISIAIPFGLTRECHLIS